MTLGEFFVNVSEQPAILLFYFFSIPLVAVLGYLWGRDKGFESPLCWIYTALIYAVCIPGIFAITLNIYLFLFERRSVMDSNIYFQILPILSMIITLYIIKLNVDFKHIPGFGKMSTLMIIIFAIFSILWILEKTHIFVISFMPFQYFIFFILAMFLLIFFGSKKFFSRPGE